MHGIRWDGSVDCFEKIERMAGDGKVVLLINPVMGDRLEVNTGDGRVEVQKGDFVIRQGDDLWVQDEI